MGAAVPWQSPRTKADTSLRRGHVSKGSVGNHAPHSTHSRTAFLSVHSLLVHFIYVFSTRYRCTNVRVGSCCAENRAQVHVTETLSCEQASAALCVIYVGEDEWRWCWPRQECYVMLANLEGTGEFILLADQDLTDVADLSDALRSSKSGSDEAEQNQWIATLELCFHFAVAPRFILAAGPHSVAALSATCMFECDVLNGLVSCSVGLSTTCDPHARAGSRDTRR